MSDPFLDDREPHRIEVRQLFDLVEPHAFPLAMFIPPNGVGSVMTMPSSVAFVRIAVRASARGCSERYVVARAKFLAAIIASS
jgi:hypothetical protein